MKLIGADWPVWVNTIYYTVLNQRSHILFDMRLWWDLCCVGLNCLIQDINSMVRDNLFAFFQKDSKSVSQTNLHSLTPN